MDDLVASRSKEAKVGIVILNWNNYKDTARCLRSLECVDYRSYVIYLVDNGSTDDSMSTLMAQFSKRDIEFILNGENLGFAAGCNRGIARALDDNCDYVLLLNNDCVVKDTAFLTTAVEFAEHHPEFGIFGGKILFWPDTQRIWSVGGSISNWGNETYIGFNEVDEGQYETAEERSFISGALMLIKREVFSAIGLLPDVYFFGLEDWEYSTRAIRAGYKLAYNPKFTVCHEANHSHDTTDPVYVYNYTLSKIIYKKRNLPRYRFAAWGFAYKTYLHAFFSLKYRAQKQKYVPGISARMIRQSMLQALSDSNRIDRITEDTLLDFRRNFEKKDPLK
ncbi:MAG TPA: glycosyltransferase family 2 protein [Candidatus Aquicultor sp.]